jgi:hypothetical protein
MAGSDQHRRWHIKQNLRRRATWNGFDLRHSQSRSALLSSRIMSLSEEAMAFQLQSRAQF